jgi:hypothetical protein
MRLNSPERKLTVDIDEDNIISFEEYRKRYENQQASNALSDVLTTDFREQNDLLSWLSFHRSFNKYKLFVHLLFRHNHYLNYPNPQIGYLIGYTPEHIKGNIDFLLDALRWESRQYILIKAAGCTFAELAEQLCDYQIHSQEKAYAEFKQTILTKNKVIVIQEISKCKIRSNKSHLARTIIKLLDDAHFDGISPQSDIIFVDYADFLQKSWQDIGIYLDILP